MGGVTSPPCTWSRRTLAERVPRPRRRWLLDQNSGLAEVSRGASRAASPYDNKFAVPIHWEVARRVSALRAWNRRLLMGRRRAELALTWLLPR